jgi:hypothetical protein
LGRERGEEAEEGGSQGVKHTIPRRHTKKIDQGPPLYSVIMKREITNTGVAVKITATPNNEIPQICGSYVRASQV